jgi:hypothetical protein
LTASTKFLETLFNTTSRDKQLEIIGFLNDACRNELIKKHPDKKDELSTLFQECDQRQARIKLLTNKIEAAYNLATEAFTLELDEKDDNKCRIQIINNMTREMHPELKCYDADEKTFADILVDRCDQINLDKIESLKTHFNHYKSHTTIFSPRSTKKMGVVDKMIELTADEKQLPEDRILKLRTDCSRNQAVLQSLRFFPIHALGYLLGIVLTPILIGIPIIYSIWNRPVAGKTMMDEVQKTVGFAR